MFQKIFNSLSSTKNNPPQQLQIDSTFIKVHRTATSLLQKGSSNRTIGRTKGGLNSKIHAVTDGNGKPIIIKIIAGNVSDYTVFDQILTDLPASKVLLAVRFRSCSSIS